MLRTSEDRPTKWDLRITAILLAVALLLAFALDGTAHAATRDGTRGAAGVSVDTAAVAYSAAVSSTCPSTSESYYTSRGWTYCYPQAVKYWAAGLYVCVAGIGKIGSANSVQFSTMRACQDFYIVTFGAIDPYTKLWYLVDLYKVWPIDANIKGGISYLIGLYEQVWRYYGTVVLPTVACPLAAAAVADPLSSTMIGTACGAAWSIVAYGG